MLPLSHGSSLSSCLPLFSIVLPTLLEIAWRQHVLRTLKRVVKLGEDVGTGRIVSSMYIPTYVCTAVCGFVVR